MTTATAEPYEGSATEDLAGVCLHLWGEEWAGPLSGCTGIALRTCQRVRASAKANKDHPKGQAVLSRLMEGLAVLGVEADRTAGLYSEAVWQISQRGRRQLTEQYVAHILQSAPGIDQESRAVGPLLDHDVNALLDEAMDVEQALVDVVDDLVAALANTASDDTARKSMKALARGVDALDGVLLIGADGRPSWILEGQTAFADNPVPVAPPWDALIMPVAVSEERVAHYAQILSQKPGYQVEAIKILAEAEDEDVERWVLAATVEEDPVAACQDMVGLLRRVFHRDASVRWLRDVGPYPKGAVTLFERDE